MRIATFGFLMAVLSHAQAVDKLKPFNAQVDAATYRGKAAIHMAPKDAGRDGMALVEGATIQDCVLELDVAGAPGPGAGDAARGFIGLAFRVQGAMEKFELFY